MAKSESLSTYCAGYQAMGIDLVKPSDVAKAMDLADQANINVRDLVIKSEEVAKTTAADGQDE